MAAGAEARFDGRVVRALSAVLGRYPLGTVVKLDTGETGLVCGRNPHFDDSTRPIVKVIAETGGGPSPQPRTIDLSKWDRENDRFFRSIVSASSPCDAFSDPADYVKLL
jgi:hypothetical protein